MRHPHADIIHAWAEGKKIQVSTDTISWMDVPASPRWSGRFYRIKPNTIKFRNYLYKSSSENSLVYIATDKSTNLENSPYFIKWIGDWQEVEIDS